MATLLSNLTESKILLEELNSTVLGPKRDSLYVVVPITIIYATIFLTGIVGNVITCTVIARNKSMHTATNYFLFSLAVSDLLLLVSGLPQEMFSIWSRYPYVFGEAFCVLRGLAAETSANATVLTITAFTVERYVAICHPFLSHTMSKLSRAIKLIMAIWVIALCAAIPQALQFGVVGESVMLCMVKRTVIEHSFEISTFLFFVTPMTLITVLYILIGLRLRGSSMMKRDTHATVSSKESITFMDGVDGKRNCRHQHGQSSRRVVKMLVAVVVAFFICWAPFHVQRLVAIYGTGGRVQHPYMMKVYEVVTYISGILYYVSTTVNPVLYHIMSNKFREAFKDTSARCCGRRSSQKRTYSTISRSAVGGNGIRCGDRRPVRQESSDSGTSMTNKHSEGSRCFNPHGNTGSFLRRENQTSITDCSRGGSLYHPRSEPSIPPRPNFNPSSLPITRRHKLRDRTARFLRAFRCLAGRSMEDKLQVAYSPREDGKTTFPDRYGVCDVTDISLKDLEVRGEEIGQR